MFVEGFNMWRGCNIHRVYGYRVRYEPVSRADGFYDVLAVYLGGGRHSGGVLIGHVGCPPVPTDEDRPWAVYRLFGVEPRGGDWLGVRIRGTRRGNGAHGKFMHLKDAQMALVRSVKHFIDAGSFDVSGLQELDDFPNSPEVAEDWDGLPSASDAF